MLMTNGTIAKSTAQSTLDQSTANNRIVALLAILDSAVPFAFVLQLFSLDIWYALTLGLKFIISIQQRSNLWLGYISAAFLYGISLIILISSFFGGSDFSDYARIFSFVLSLLMTLSLLTRQNLSSYVTVCAYTIGVSTLLYILMVHSGHYEGEWGRYNYFADSHPNLGSEIIAMSVLYASCVLSPMRLIAFCIPSIYAINLMQGRAGIMVCVLAAVTSIYTRLQHSTTRMMVAVFVIIAIVASLTMFSEATSAFLNSVLLLNDEHRGGQTGFVGRDELWGGAWKAFLDSPVYGNGAGFEERLGVNPHNYFLYGLSFFGFLSLFVFGVVFYLYFDLYKTNFHWFCVLIVTSIMFIFNDRFLNLNPYPFLLYVVLFAHAQDRFRTVPLSRLQLRSSSPR
jgi:hypothetical protein